MENENNKIIKSYRISKDEMSSTETEKKIAIVFCDIFDLSPDVIWVDSNFFDFGITSVDLIAFKVRVEKRLALNYEIPMLMLIRTQSFGVWRKHWRC